MELSLSDYAGSLGWMGAALAVNAGLAVAIYRGRVRADGRFQRTMSTLAGLLGMRAVMSLAMVWQSSLSGGPGPALLLHYLWLSVVAIFILCSTLSAFVDAVIRWRWATGRALPRAPARRGNFGGRA